MAESLSSWRRACEASQRRADRQRILQRERSAWWDALVFFTVATILFSLIEWVV